MIKNAKKRIRRNYKWRFYYKLQQNQYKDEDSEEDSDVEEDDSLFMLRQKFRFENFGCDDKNNL